MDGERQVGLALKYLMFIFGINTAVHAGTSEVSWLNPEKYRDVKSGNESKTKYQARVFKEFEKHFQYQELLQK